MTHRSLWLRRTHTVRDTVICLLWKVFINRCGVTSIFLITKLLNWNPLLGEGGGGAATSGEFFLSFAVSVGGGDFLLSRTLKGMFIAVTGITKSVLLLTGTSDTGGTSWGLSVPHLKNYLNSHWGIFLKSWCSLTELLNINILSSKGSLCSNRAHLPFTTIYNSYY